MLGSIALNCRSKLFRILHQSVNRGSLLAKRQVTIGSKSRIAKRYQRPTSRNSWDADDGGRKYVKEDLPFFQKEQIRKTRPNVIVGGPTVIVKVPKDPTIPPNQKPLSGDRHTLGAASAPAEDGGASIETPELPSVTLDNQYERLSQELTPLYTMSYHDQLRQKNRQISELLVTLRYGLKKVKNYPRINTQNLICELEFAMRSPVSEGYRNDFEFSVHHGVDFEPRVVGCLLANGGAPVCVPPNNLVNVSESYKHIASRFQDFVRSSPHEARRDPDFKDIYQKVSIRSTKDGQHMAILKIHPRDLTSEQLSAEKNRLKEFFSEGPGKDCNLASLYLQSSKRSMSKAQQDLIFGEQYLYTETLGKKMQISPRFHFEDNLAAVEEVCKLFLEFGKPDLTTTLLELGSGDYGLTSLIFSSHVCRCIAICGQEKSLKNAKKQAELNGVTNINFICSSTNSNLFGDLDTSANVIAMINAERDSTLRLSVVNNLRKCFNIKTLIYVTHNPTHAVLQDSIQLCRSEDEFLRGEEFHLSRAVPVDMLPHTNYCMLVLVFTRRQREQQMSV